jgi:hypothetical protein
MNFYERQLRERSVRQWTVLAANNLEERDWLKTSYDSLFGYLTANQDPYARAAMVRHLDRLYESALTSLDKLKNQGWKEHPSDDKETNHD